MKGQRTGSGWRNESHRHRLAGMGIKTSNNMIVFSSSGLSENKYFKLDTGLPVHQNMMENPEYFRKNKGIQWKIIWLTSDEYEDAIEKGFREESRLLRGEIIPIQEIRERILPEHLEKIKGIMVDLENKGEGIEMPNLRYSTHYGYRSEIKKPFFDQEGHHRAVASRELGENLIPVFIEYPTDQEDIELIEQYMTEDIKRKVLKERGDILV